jgi:GH15 family glucan-1,4-alpha-glucosidase
MTNGHQPIEDYGVIGDMHTVALVGKSGSIDFMSFPNFNSPAIFAAPLDGRRGARFAIVPELCGSAQKQLCLPDANVLITQALRRRIGRCRTSCPSGLNKHYQRRQAAG